MNTEESRLKEEYGGGLIIMRRHGEALMVGTDLAVMVVRVDGGQVRLWVSSKTQQSVLMEKKYRENQAARKAGEVRLFHPFFKIGDTYVLSVESGGEEMTEPVRGVTIARFDSLLEATSFSKGAQLMDPQAKIDVERQHRDAFVLIYRQNDEPFRFVDYSKL